MLNGVNLNYVIVLLVTGSVFLAAIYHTILYVHRKTILLSGYSAYLWASFLYCSFRAIHFLSSGSEFPHWSPDEVFQMIAFILYIRFAAIAWELHPVRDKYALTFARLTPYVVFVYLIMYTIFINIYFDSAYAISKLIIRMYLLLIGLLMVVVVLRKRQSAFFRYLAAGAISMIVCGIVSTISNVFIPPEVFVLGALSWLMFGFFTDVVFFSAAIGYRIRQEHEEREHSLKALMQKETELQQKELEKVKAVYETREQERSRIAHDLHDEIGATLSGIALYSQLTKTQLQSQKNQEVEQSLDRMQQSATEMVYKLSDIVWAVNPEKDSLHELWQRLDDYLREMAAMKNIKVQSECDLPVTDIKFSMEERRNIYLLLKESINNAVKYSHCSLLKLNLVNTNSQLIFTVSDNGKGFDQTNLQKGNGLLFMNHRAKELNAQLLLESALNCGTNLQLILNIPQ